jgi:hypothetical protein
MPLSDQIYESLGPFAAEDESGDLEKFTAAQTAPVELIYEIVGEEDQDYGWSIVFDVDNCPPKALPWLAQFEGVELTPDMSVAQQRAAIRAREGSARGRPNTIIERIRRTLSVDRRVIFREKDGDPYHLAIRTFAAETPNPALTEAAALSQKPAGIVLDFLVIDENSYETLKDEYADYAAVTATGFSYTELLLDLSE